MQAQRESVSIPHHSDVAVDAISSNDLVVEGLHQDWMMRNEECHRIHLSPYSPWLTFRLTTLNSVAMPRALIELEWKNSAFFDDLEERQDKVE